MFARHVGAGVLLVVTLGASTPAHSAGLDALPPSLRQTTECMYRVLKTIPRVTNPVMGVKRGRNANQLQPIVWDRPFVEYTYTYDDGQRERVRFTAEMSRSRKGRVAYSFGTVLSGLTSLKSERPDWGTREIGDLWKSRCGTDVSVMFM